MPEDGRNDVDESPGQGTAAGAGVSYESNEDSVWEEGYRLATAVLEVLHLEAASAQPIDIDAVYQALGIGIDSIELRDRSIRAVAIAGTQFCPTVLLNLRYEFLEEETRRFTLAHELCHILHDRGYRAQLAMASGPWAPVDVERRANAFAAMFLMPRELVGAVVRAVTQALETPAAIWTVANALRMSYSSTLEHLCNLGFIAESLRDSLRIESRPDETARA